MWDGRGDQRGKRGGLNLLTALSLLLCVAVATLWVRSYRAAEVLYWIGEDAAGGQACAARASRGGLVFSRESWDAGVGGLRRGYRPGLRRETEPPLLLKVNRFGFGAGGISGTAVGPAFSGESRWVTIPLWLVPILAATPAAARGVAAVRRRLRPKPLNPCRHCGYDLTGNVSGVCPECGKAIEAGR